MFDFCIALESLDLSSFNTSSVTNMHDMFYSCNSLKSLNLSSFDTSSVTSMLYMFSSCYSLESLDLSSFNTSSVTTMSSMFSYCYSLKSLNLSNFNTSSVTDMSFMFDSCNSLKYLDLSNFDLKRLSQHFNIFYDFGDINNTKYINLYNIQNYDKSKSVFSTFNGKTDFIVCQKDIIIENITNKCCIYNIQIQSCEPEPDNYIILKFKKEAYYPYGFSFVEYDQSLNQYRKEKYFIKYQYKKFQPNDGLKIIENSEIYIYFNSTVTNLKKFFYNYYDPNAEYIISIDLSHFNSSLLESLDSTFYGCSLLESINLSNFNTPLLTNMNKTFFHCNSLKSIDLSDFNFSLVTYINRMFCGCNSLKYLNLNNLDITNVEDTSYMFYNIKNLKYINIYSIKLNDNFLNELRGQYGLNEDYNIIVCQSDKLIDNPNDIYSCCDYDIENNECECSNYILVYYKEGVVYTNGFFSNQENNKIEGRNNISYIYYDNNVYNNNDKLIINKNSNIKLCFAKPITNLEKFFDANSDANAEKIISIDFSHFDSSLITNMNKIFFGCKELVALDISNFHFDKVKSFENMFYNDINLKYINIYNAINNENLSSINVDELNNQNILVCQKINILNNENFRNLCCDFNIELKKCQSTNYMTIRYGRPPSNLFWKNKDNIHFIIKGNETFLINQNLTVEENSIIEIHFSSSITSLDKFFENEINVISVDLSHFDSSLVESMNSMFYGCISIQEINFTNFNTTKVTNMSYMFYYCSFLKSLDLSNFNTTSVTNMSYMFTFCNSLESLDLLTFNTSSVTDMSFMFESCKSLKSLDLSTFNTSKVNNMSYMFIYCNSLEYLDISNFDLKSIENSPDILNILDRVPNIKYINLYNVQNYNILKSAISLFNGKEGLIVCQKENIIENIIIDFSYFNIQKKSKELNNYIIVHYEEHIVYENGFKINNEEINEYRNDIDFIELENNIIAPSEHLEVKSSSSIKINFLSSISNLSNFFNSKYDPYVTNIISIDFSNFNSSLITDVNSLFKGCSSLETIIFPNFKTSLVTNMSENVFRM